MALYPARVMERAMKIQEVILRAVSGKILWMQAAEILGISDRGMRRWKQRYEEHGYDGLLTGGGNGPVPSGCRWLRWRRYCDCIESITFIST